MRFDGFNLNLLVVLDALLEEKNVTRAAERLHIGQSAASGSLAQLRSYFGDELLVTCARPRNLRFCYRDRLAAGGKNRIGCFCALQPRLQRSGFERRRNELTRHALQHIELTTHDVLQVSPGVSEATSANTSRKRLRAS
ncbi:LysR family transcriptional regulator [Pseudorhodoferax sp. Leaf274]|uniref:LysR family transcriptional regulator n=1 Tax=Pseudorhodoferax sp. Leaf274 TaxID=1736318 RepID=UPI00070371CB|nr:hypothetical protein ASF44_27755 [Pseudorhodoferax sp. Leaf274]